MLDPVLRFLLVGIIVTGISSCKINNREATLPPMTGKPGEVVLVMDDQLYKGMAGDSIYNLLCQDELALPQTGYEGAEPMFDLVQIPPAAMSDIFRSHRNILFADISSEVKTPKIKTERDYWSKDQLIFRIAASDVATFVKILDDNREFIISALRDAEIDRQYKLNRRYENIELASSMVRKHQISMSFPKGFEARIDTGQFIWVQYSPQEMIQGVLIWYTPYTNESQVTYENLIQSIDQPLKPRVPGSQPRSFMQLELELPVYSRVIDHNSNYTRELRGLWETEGDFMGGPFISWSLIDEKHNRLVTLFGFVYAPKYNKRNHIRKVESILKTVSFTD